MSTKIGIKQGLPSTIRRNWATRLAKSWFSMLILRTSLARFMGRWGRRCVSIRDSFCRLEFQLAQQEAVQLIEILSRKFSRISLVYSGRGFHIHVRDEETVFWNRKKRLMLVRSLINKGFVMDEWVPPGGMRLIRLPY